ncbi:ATP-binding cassette sub-family A member 9-like [Dermacentor andersoni]|uniref:ATP-binding cassette sub-family A member 9-like n=1 Tax=Dermacentor andersoni TaxID=34620 RepID=UPI003B3BB6E7
MKETDEVLNAVADWQVLSRKGFNVDNLSLGASWFATILSCVLIVALIWYLTHVLPSVCDHPLATGFLFTVECAFLKSLRPSFVAVTGAQKNYWLPRAHAVLEVPATPEQQQLSALEELPESVKVVVEADNVTKEYAKIKAVTRVSLKALDNQITVILGADGAGKSTLLRLLSGNVPPTSGHVTVCNMDTVLSRPMVRTVASFCPRLATFSVDMTVWEHLLLYAVLKGVPLRNIWRRAREVLSDTDFNEKIQSFPHLLSEIAQQRLLLAISLLNKPRVLFLDEPTCKLDEEARREVWTLLESIRASCAIVMTSTMTEEADVVGDRVAIMSHGRVRCCGTPTFLKQAHGTGYEIRFPKTEKVLNVEHHLLSIVRQRTGQARLSQTPRNVVISLGTRDTRGFTDMFKHIEEFCHSHGIYDIGVTFSTLEDVFIKMSTEPDNVDLNIIPDVESSCVQAFSDEPVSTPSIGGQLAALLFKRRATLAIDRAAPLMVYVLFAAMMLFMEYLQSGPAWLVTLFPDYVTPPRDLSFLRQQSSSDHGVNIDIGTMYPKSVTFLRGTSELSSHYYLPLIRDVTTIWTIDGDPSDELDLLARKHFFHYSRKYVIGADFSDPSRCASLFRG